MTNAIRPLDPHQARTHEPTAYEMKLAGAIEEVFGSGRHDLTGLVEGLNDMGVLGPGGEPWTEDTFRDEIKQLEA